MGPPPSLHQHPATTYHHDRGFLTDVTYNDNGATPPVSITYDDLGRPDTVSNAVATTEYTYAPDLGVDTETITYNLPGQPSFIRLLDRAPRSLGRDTGWQLKDGATVENSATYTYGATDGRMATVSGGGFQPPGPTFTYGYQPGSSLIQSITGPAHTVTNTWEEHRDILLAKTNHLGNPAAPVSKFNYDIPKPSGGPSDLGANLIGQREKVTTTGTAFAAAPADWTWDYDSMGQLTTAAASTPANSRAYQYDAIGNRKFSEISNFEISNPPAPGTTAYTANHLNQYTAIATGGTVQLPAPTNDYDGNQTTGPLPADPSANATLRWDAENRLTEVIDSTGATLVRYHYDAASRRIATITSGGATTYFYDGWNRIAEYTLQNSVFALHASYLWGSDLSGSMQGAGGVGGLLAVRIHGTGAGSGTYYPTFDGNGNISEYLDAGGVIKARYQYDPFGNTLELPLLSTEDATLRASFAYRFSTKPIDPLTGLYDYGYRWYDPLTGRWKSRDPFREIGHEAVKDWMFAVGGLNHHILNVVFPNTYDFGRNSPTIFVDANGEFIPLIVGAAAALVYGVVCVADKLMDMHVRSNSETLPALRKIADASTGDEIRGAGKDFVGSLDEHSNNIAQIAESMPGTSITGPVSDPRTAAPILNPTDKPQLIVEGVRILANVRAARCACKGDEAVRLYKAFKDAMTSAGYRWVATPGGANSGAGYLRRPPGNPGNLPDPKEINLELAELFSKACDAN